MTDSQQHVFFFGNGTADGSAQDKDQLGGKGANLAEMTRLGLPVPPGFTITTTACNHTFQTQGAWPEGMEAQVRDGVSRVGEMTGKSFGGADNPLLFSVRSGAPESMPGMMDTVLNLGLNRTTVEGLAAKSENPMFAWDSYRRFLTMFGDVVLGIHGTLFQRAAQGVLEDTAEEDLDLPGLRALCTAYETVIKDNLGHFPEDPWEQLQAAINAVFKSFNTQRARYYRKSHGLAAEMGTAVTVQAMVFGNMGEDSATGVAFSRDPASGEPVFYGEWLPNAQGEDVVAGTHTPLPLNRERDANAEDTLEMAMPEAYAELQEIRGRLEAHFCDMQDIEFTIESGTLYLLQTRTGKRTPGAAVRIAVDLANEGLIDEETALARVEPELLEMVLRPVLDPDARRKVLCKGLPASPGAASGKVVFHSAEAQELHDRGEKVILVRMETSPEDIQGMTVSEAILTSRGGQTSHAAVVARGMGRPCVVGATDIVVDYGRQLFYAGDTVVKRGDVLTLDGGTGEVIEGEVPTLEPPTDTGAMGTLLEWAGTRARLTVRANADNAKDAVRARELGAKGIGLCRTEHMFFQPDALRSMRQLILASDRHAQLRALSQILPIQRTAFLEIFQAMDGLPVTIRLLDPPLHEFLPTSAEDISSVADDLGVRIESLEERIQTLHESNPMMGHRGVRLGITSPDIYATQVRALMEAAVLATEAGVEVLPEIMIPLVATRAELERTRERAIAAAEDILEEAHVRVDYKVGTMIELPRAALMAHELAHVADFFSFGTNDLTQMTFGFSRDDMGKFFNAYVTEGLLTDSPLAVFDIDGVGQLVQMGVEKGRGVKPELKVGICGEHGGDPQGIGFFHRIGLDYVSCSPFRVPVARLAAAHAALGLL